MIKPILILAVMVLTGASASAHYQTDTVMTTQFKITANGKELIGTFADTPSGAAFRNLMADAPLSVAMDDYGGFEKVGSLGHTLPTNDTRITTVTGDVMLYLGSEITIFYGSNTWSYSRLGKIDGNPTADAILDVLGVGSTTVTFSLKGSGVNEVYTDALAVSVSGRVVTVENASALTMLSVYNAGGALVCSVPGNMATLPAAGIYIIECGGKRAKVMVK